jgi:hypothetical protein
MQNEDHSDTLDVTATASDHTTANAEPAQAAETAKPEPTAADAVKATDTGGDGDSTREQPDPRSKSQKRARVRSESANRTGTAAGEEPRTLAERLLAPLELPRVTLDRKLLPAKLLGALDAAGLGTPEILPAATFMTLAAVGAIAGPDARCEPGENLQAVLGNAHGLSLRIALLTDDRPSPLVPAAILAGAYAAESDLLDIYNESIQRDAEWRRVAEQRRRLHQQATQAALTLGIEPPPALPNAVPAQIGSRPRIVVLNGAAAAIRTAAAGGTGTLIVDERRAPWMAHVGDNFDLATDELLNAVAAGHRVPIIADPIGGRTVMWAFPAGVIGALTTEDCALLHKAARAQLVASLFVLAAAPPTAGDGGSLIALIRRVIAMPADAVTLRLTAQADMLATAAAAWTDLATDMRSPLGEYCATLPDLARRLAALLHLAAAAAGDGNLGHEIPSATVKRAIGIVDSCILPTARAVLGPTSTTEVERDARRVIAHLRETTSPVNRVFERRPLLRAWQKSMTVARLDRTLDLLQQEALIVSLDKVDGGKGGQHFEVAPVLLAAA